ncbi:hypothetical protein FPSE_10681 [Fusarium pseudograminearum CS3096]|uniref:Carrier domain-containing protein n=1 Tax=Fusarium pseudograminearum (strain CS3096) TaxID=1028729 RepID=K3V6X0_FUSPC|nr:hypothetical protein FPSE_10681 [Fusarium pseudograminearum CS3096]EKJ69157.1 hypothetical protein FPSE_10681 [Fusarium pseudograminearum CS3096]
MTVEQSTDAKCLTLDSIIRGLAGNTQTILSYVTTNDDFANFTGSDIERLTTIGANGYLQALKGQKDFDLKTAKSKGVIALIGTSTLEYYITFLSIQRLGFTTVLLSPKLTHEGVAHLLDVTECCAAIVPESHRTMFDKIPLCTVPMIRDVFALDSQEYSSIPELECHSLDQTPGVVVHSGGTTSGLPKPISAPSGAWIAAVAGTDAKSHRLHTLPTFNTMPLYHTFGLGVLFRALRMGTRVSLVNADRPLVAEAIFKGLGATKSRCLTTVPYVLKFLAEEDGGVEKLAKLDFLSVGGAAVPDDLGQSLIDAGVNLKTTYGQSESGILMLPVLDDDKQWGWLEPMEHAEPFMRFEPAEGDLYHLVILPGLASKTMTDRPDGSYGTKDLFEKHPHKPRLWKFVARHDDMIVLSNGENANPVPLESALMNNPNVAMAVAFGAGQESLGVIIIPSSHASNLVHEDLLKSVEPDLNLGNERMPAYARVSLDAVTILPADTELPMTGKSTLQRALFYRQFSTIISGYYSNGGVQNGVGTLPEQSFNDAEISSIVHEIVFHHHPPMKDQSDADFFTMGMDSLQASRIRAEILRRIYIKPEKVATNVVFNHPNLSLLSHHIVSLYTGRQGSMAVDPQEIARSLIRKYTCFTTKEGTGKRDMSSVPEASTIVCIYLLLIPNLLSLFCVLTLLTVIFSFQQLLTGATGYLGVQILHNLLSRGPKDHVYCLVRARDNAEAESRLDQALANSKLTLPKSIREKAVALAGDLGRDKLGLNPDDYGALLCSVTNIIHNAWAVNFSMSLSSFEPQLAGVWHLIELALSAPQTPEVVFISSIVAVASANPPAQSSASCEPTQWEGSIMERRYGWEAVGSLGYGQSKWVAEEICYSASEHTGLPVKVIRLGQISGDTHHGIWNPSEAVPTIILSALTAGALPRIEADNVFRVGDAQLWIPSDVAAASIVELTFSEVGECIPSSGPDEASSQSNILEHQKTIPYTVFHVSGSHPASWNAEILPSLRNFGLEFEVVSQSAWVDKLASSDPDVSRNPPYKLIEFFKGSTQVEDQLHAVDTKASSVQVHLDISLASKYAPSLAQAGSLDETLMRKYLEYWKKESWQKLERNLVMDGHKKEMGSL